jgi:hypothetical protein
MTSRFERSPPLCVMKGPEWPRELCRGIGLSPRGLSGDQRERCQAAEQRRSSDYPIRTDRDFRAIAEQRGQYRTYVEA